MPDKKGQSRLLPIKKHAFDYFVEDKFEAGIELFGTEVKSIRQGQINLKIRTALLKTANFCAGHAYFPL